jgi:hypothetical protein
MKLSSIINDSIVINSLNPYFCKTGLGGESSDSARAAHAVFASLFAHTTEEGSRLIVKVASAERVMVGICVLGNWKPMLLLSGMRKGLSGLSMFERL